MMDETRLLPRFAPTDIAVERLCDGGLILRSRQELGETARCIGDKLASWASWMPHRIFLAER